MHIPLPALLAAIVLLSWPAGRLYATWIKPKREQFSKVASSTLKTLKKAIAETAVIAVHFGAFLIALGTMLLLRMLFQRLCGADVPPLFGAVSMDVLFELAILAQFAIFVFWAAWDSKRITDRTTAEGDSREGDFWGVYRLSSFTGLASNWWRAEVAVYASTGALAVLVIAIGVSLSAIHKLGPV